MIACLSAGIRTFGRNISLSALSQRVYYMMSNISKKASDVIYVALPDRPVYLQLAAKSESETRGDISKFSQDETRTFLVFPAVCEELLSLKGYVKSAIMSQTVYRKSSECSNAVFSHCLAFSKELYSAPKERGCIKRGICVQFKADVEVNDEVNTFLGEVEAGFTVSELQVTGNKLTLKTVDSEEHYTVISPEEDVSPVFALPEMSPVFHTYEEARNILEMCMEMPEVVELLAIADKRVPKSAITGSVEQSLKHPFIVVEGLDAAGKTTVTQILEKKLAAARYYTPPPHIYQLRPFFDRLPEIIRRAYYSLGNYIVAQEIVKECQTRPVIMDRFWHSTSAYGIANETSSEDLPPPSHSVYNWPQDLLRPTLVLFLTVTEDVRRQRHSGRGDMMTFEEKSLDKDQLFRQRLCDAYRRMVDPPCLEIDACGTIETVVQSAQDLLMTNNIHLEHANGEPV